MGNSIRVHPRVLLAKIALDGHDRGVKVLARSYRDAGIEVIYTGLWQTCEATMHAALQEDVGVVALSDVYPGYKSAKETKGALRRFAGDAGKHANFRPHAAQFEVKALLLPSWDEIAKELGVKAASPGANPEQVNGPKPLCRHRKELFRRGNREFDKILDGPKWLTADRLERAANLCPELRSFLDSPLDFAGAHV